MKRLCALLAVGFAFNLPTASAAPRIEGGAIVLDAPIAFVAGRAELKPESEPALLELKEFLAQKPALTLVRVEGHVAAGGDEAKNQTLSEARALAVTRWLVAHGIDCSRLLPVGFGASKPVADASTPEGRAQNTRVGFAPAMLRGKAIGGMPVDGGGRRAADPCAP